MSTILTSGRFDDRAVSGFKALGLRAFLKDGESRPRLASIGKEFGRSRDSIAHFLQG